MKKTKLKREGSIGKQYAILRSQHAFDLEELANRISYGGNAKHKKTPWFGGDPRPDTKGTLCPNFLHDQQASVVEWLKQTVLAGAIDSRYNGGYPKHVWYMHEGIMYEAKLDQKLSGSYHGNPLKDPKFWPRGYERIYGDI